MLAPYTQITVTTPIVIGVVHLHIHKPHNKEAKFSLYTHMYKSFDNPIRSKMYISTFLYCYAKCNINGNYGNKLTRSESPSRDGSAQPATISVLRTKNFIVDALL
jgi:hypothetical protein